MPAAIVQALKDLKQSIGASIADLPSALEEGRLFGRLNIWDYTLDVNFEAIPAYVTSTIIDAGIVAVVGGVTLATAGIAATPLALLGTKVAGFGALRTIRARFSDKPQAIKIVYRRGSAVERAMADQQRPSVPLNIYSSAFRDVWGRMGLKKASIAFFDNDPATGGLANWWPAQYR